MRASIVVLLAVLTAGCGYALAGRGSFLPDYIRSSAFRRSRTAALIAGGAGSHREDPHRVHRPRQVQVVPDAPGSDAVLTGRVSASRSSRSASTEQQLASRYLFTLTMKVSVHRCADQQGAVVERRADVP